MHLVFFGTSEFAVPALAALVKTGYEVMVITTPDARAGRKQKLASSPVKLAAKKFGLPVLQPKELKDLVLIPDTKYQILDTILGVVAAYGKIIPAEIINFFPKGILNIHPSLLPKYRGPSPIQSALLNGDSETGVTIIRIDAEIDHGPIISSQGMAVSSKDLYKDLEKKLAKLGAELLVKVLPDYLARDYEVKPQDDTQATFTKMISRKDGQVDWHRNARAIYNQFRAFHHWPGIWMEWNNKILKLITIDVSPRSYESVYIGKMRIEDGKIIIPCLSQSITVLSLQLPGGKIMTAKEFINGYGKSIESQERRIG